MLTAAEIARAEGLSSLAEACRISGRRPQTLHKWHNDNPDFFRVVIVGCGEIKRREEALQAIAEEVARESGNLETNDQ